MTSLDADIVRRKLAAITRKLDQLAAVAGMPLDRYRADPFRVKGTEKLLQETVEAAVDARSPAGLLPRPVCATVWCTSMRTSTTRSCWGQSKRRDCRSASTSSRWSGFWRSRAYSSRSGTVGQWDRPRTPSPRLPYHVSRLPSFTAPRVRPVVPHICVFSHRRNTFRMTVGRLVGAIVSPGRGTLSCPSRMERFDWRSYIGTRRPELAAGKSRSSGSWTDNAPRYQR